MATFHITYKKTRHPTDAEVSLNMAARLVSGQYTWDGAHSGTVTCEDKYAWLLEDGKLGTMVQTYTRK